MRLEEIVKLATAATEPPLKRLTRGAPVGQGLQALKALTPASLLDTTIINEEAGRAVLCGLYVACDGFEEAHELAQGIPSYLGSWWHAMLHRREPDASNSAYWYRRVKAPAQVYEALGRAALDVVTGSKDSSLKKLGDALRRSGRWEPLVFVEACEQARSSRSPTAALETLLRLQELEWRRLLDHGMALATGKT